MLDCMGVESQAENFTNLLNCSGTQSSSSRFGQYSLLVLGGQNICNYSCLPKYRLGLNPLGDEGAQYIAEAVRQNSSQSVKDIL